MSKEPNKKDNNNLFVTNKRKRDKVPKNIFKKNSKVKKQREDETVKNKEQEESNDIVNSEKINVKPDGMYIDSDKSNKLYTNFNQVFSNRDDKENLQKDNILTQAIEKIKSNDENIILNFLFELSENLSLAHESLAENSNCSLLLKNLIDIFDKFNHPELSIQCLICINYLIDINPYLCNNLILNGGVKKIVCLTQNVEYIDLAENAIKTLEKISFENAYVLLENDALSAILLFIDFFDTNIKKYVINICLNISRHVKNYETFKNKVLNCLPALTSLTKLSGSSELDKIILDKAIISFCNILHSIKNNKLYHVDEKIWESITEYGLVKNLTDILVSIFQMLNNSKPSGNKSNLAIFMDTFKNIIKILQLLCEQSTNISNQLIDMNIFETLYTILKEELEISNVNNNILDKSRVSISNHSIFNELFPFLQSFFPNKDSSNEGGRLIIDNTSCVYKFFSQKIISLLIDNFVNISSSQVSLKILKLLNVYFYYSDKENLSLFIDSLKLANIMSKMLDSRDFAYLVEIFDIIQIIMEKVPELFLVELIREGVVDNIKEINLHQLNDFFISSDEISSFANSLMQKYKHIFDEINTEDKGIDINIKSEKKENNLLIEDKYDYSEDEPQSFLNIGKKKENEITDTYVNSNFTEKIQHTKKSNYDIIYLIVKKRSLEILNLYFNDNLRVDVFKKLNIVNSKSNPDYILSNLIELSEKIKNSNEEFDSNKINRIFELIFSENKVTYHEIEKSKIIYNLVNYIDINFDINMKERKNIKNMNYEKNIIPKLNIIFSGLNYDIDRIKMLISLLHHCISSSNCFKVCLYEYNNYKNTAHLFVNSYKHQDKKYKINLLYVMDEETLDENGLDPLYQDLHQYYIDDNNKKVVEVDSLETFSNLQEAIIKKEFNRIPVINDGIDVEMNESSNKYEDLITTINKRKGSEDIENTELILSQLLERKHSMISNYEEILNSNSNSNLVPFSLKSEKPLIRKNRYNVNFFVLIEEKKFYINKKWNFNDFIRELKNNFSKKQQINFFNELEIKFQITVKDEILNIVNRKKSSINLPVYNYILNQKNDHNIIEEILFNDFYRRKIISNPSLYCVNKASCYLYLICLFELSVNQFGGLFKFSSKLKDKILENKKVSSLLTKQVRDPYAISSNTIPSWCKEFSCNFPFISSFNSRYLYFKTCTFDLKRSMTNLYIYVKNYMSETVSEDKTLANNKRRKFIVDRENIIKSTEKLIQEYGTYSGYLEFEYLNEIGSGAGPTLEFYSIFIKELTLKNQIWYKTTNKSIYPAPYLSRQIGIKQNEKLFIMLGFVLARGLYDDRLIDIQLNSVFWDAVLDRPIPYLKICKIDEDLGRAVNDFINILKNKTEIISSYELIEEDEFKRKKYLEDNLRYNNVKIEDIGLNFVLPGYNNFELKENGYNVPVTAYNLEEYLDLVFNSICYEGIKESVNAFRKGFNFVFPVESLNCFTSEELEDGLCGSRIEYWDYESLNESILANHGYDKNSLIYKQLIDILLNMQNEDRKLFLLFVTGCSRLPFGGFKNLYPKMTIVKKGPDNPNETPDKYLPTVMTCQNYLKIPDYTSNEIFKSRLYMAMYEGGNSFDLS